MDTVSYQTLEKHRIIPVISIDDAGKAVDLAQALMEGGIGVIEITLRTPAAVEAIRRIRENVPDVLLGAGTVLSAEQAREAVDAGAQFGLSPGIALDAQRVFAEAGCPFIPGVMTPSEVQRAVESGCRHLKFFPAAAAGGPKFLKAMAAPYGPSLKFCPTGGISLENMGDYLALPSVFAIGGSWLAPRDLIETSNWQSISQNARQALATLK